MAYKSDIEIAQECTMAPITEVAAKAGIDDRYLEQYGKYKAKINYSLLKESEAPDGKLVLVTAINPTPAGEGKTTTTVGLADGLRKIGKKSVAALCGGGQRLPHRHKGGTGSGGAGMPETGGKRGSVPGLSQGRRGRHCPGRGSGSALRRGSLRLHLLL